MMCTSYKKTKKEGVAPTGLFGFWNVVGYKVCAPTELQAMWNSICYGVLAPL